MEWGEGRRMGEISSDMKFSMFHTANFSLLLLCDERVFRVLPFFSRECVGVGAMLARAEESKLRLWRGVARRTTHGIDGDTSRMLFFDEVLELSRSNLNWNLHNFLLFIINPSKLFLRLVSLCWTRLFSRCWNSLLLFFIHQAESLQLLLTTHCFFEGITRELNIPNWVSFTLNLAPTLTRGFVFARYFLYFFAYNLITLYISALHLLYLWADLNTRIFLHWFFFCHFSLSAMNFCKYFLRALGDAICTTKWTRHWFVHF